MIFKEYFFSQKTSFFLALIFLTHPVLTQAVAWIPGRNDSLLAIFILTSFYFFLNFLKTDRLTYLWWHLAFFVMALFVKENAVFLPLICVAYYYLFDDKFTTENKQSNFLIIFVTWFCSLTVWYLFRKVSLPNNTSLGSMALSGWHNFSAVLVYFGKVIFPFNLGVYPVIKDLTYWYGFSAILFFSIVTYFTTKLNWRRLLFGGLWFIIFLLPSLLNSDPSLEHRLYLPIIGLLFCFAELYPLKNLKWQTRKCKIMAVVIIIIFSVLTIFHSKSFSDRLSFWTQATKNSPSSAFSFNNLGAMNYLDGNFEEAKKDYLQALSLDSRQQLVHNNLGLIAMNQGRLSEAESEYKKELQINPYYDNTWANLGTLYLSLKRFSEAKQAFVEAYRINPNNLQAYNGLLNLSSN